MKQFLSGVVTISLLAFFSPIANAEVIKGEVTGVSQGAKSFQLICEDTKKELQIGLSEKAKSNGLDSLSQMVAGDEVVVDVKRNPATNQWEADSIEVVKAVIQRS